MVYLELNKKFVDENLEKWNEEAILNFGEEGRDKYFYSDNEIGTIRHIDQKSDKITIICRHSKLGFISMDVKLDIQDLLFLWYIKVKKMRTED